MVRPAVAAGNMFEAIIDRAVVEELVEDVAGGDPTLLLELVGMFAHDGPNRSARIGAAAQSGDRGALEREVHALKGSAGNLGARRVAHVADALWLASRRGETAELVRLADELETHLAEAVRALRRLADAYR